MTYAEWIQLWALIVTSTGVFIALVFSLKQSYLMRQQLKVNMFADYTKRYQQITLNLPENINDTDFDLYKHKKEKPELYDKIMRHMRSYFDLCSEEYFLNKKKLIENVVWKEWSEGIRSTFKQKAYIDAWEIADSNFYDEFADWMKNDVLNQKN